MNLGFRFGRLDQTGKCNTIGAFFGGVNFRVLFEIGRGLNFLQFWAVTATRRGVAARVVSRYGGKIIIKLELRLILFFFFWV